MRMKVFAAVPAIGLTGVPADWLATGPLTRRPGSTHRLMYGIVGK